MYKKKIFANEEHYKVLIYKDLDKWCKEGGWKNAGEFLQESGVSFEEIKGKWFYYAMGRLFIKDDTFGGVF